MTQIKKLLKFLPLVVVFIAFFGLTASSPIYVTNQWDDTNVSFTVARAWIHGQLPYLNLFEQRGPLYYMVFTIAVLISNKSFLGLFVIEIVLGIVSYLGLLKIIQISGHRLLSKFVALLMFSLVYGANVFGYGGSPEEIVLPCLIWFMYIVLNNVYSDGAEYQNKDLIAMGALFSAVFWIKCSMTGAMVFSFMYIGLAAIVKRNVWLFFKRVFLSIIGFLIPTSLVVLVMALFHDLKPMLDVYFITNITRYGSKMDFLQRVIALFRASGQDVLGHPFILVALLVSLFILGMTAKQENQRPGIMLTTVVVGQIVLVYFSGTGQWYYYLAVLGIIIPIISFAVGNKIPYLAGLISERQLVVIVLVLSVIQLGAGNSSMKNAEMKGVSLTPTATKVVGDYIKTHSDSKNPTLIEYGGIDGGFFLASDAIPTKKYFEQTNFPIKTFSNSYNAQLHTIEHRSVQYVMIRSNTSRDFRNQLLVTEPQKFTQIKWYDSSNAEHEAYVPIQLIMKYKLVLTSYNSILGDQINTLLFERRQKPLKSIKAFNDEGGYIDRKMTNPTSNK